MSFSSRATMTLLHRTFAEPVAHPKQRPTLRPRHVTRCFVFFLSRFFSENHWTNDGFSSERRRRRETISRRGRTKKEQKKKKRRTSGAHNRHNNIVLYSQSSTNTHTHSTYYILNRYLGRCEHSDRPSVAEAGRAVTALPNLTVSCRVGHGDKGRARAGGHRRFRSPGRRVTARPREP